MGKKRRRSDYHEEKPPKGCHHYNKREDVPWDIQKYFEQRYSIFSRYDEGIWMTDGAWYGVTPEPVADMIAYHLSAGAPAEKTILIDVFGGAGGNTIAFAKSGRWKQVYSIEKDPQVLECAKHNAEVYGVSDQISWIEGDCFEAITDKLAGIAESAVVFASPPWGGPGYRTDKVFDLSTMEPYNLDALLTPLQQFTKDIVLFLPRTSDLRQLLQWTDGEKKIDVMHYCMEGASKALCAYFGNLQVG